MSYYQTKWTSERENKKSTCSYFEFAHQLTIFCSNSSNLKRKEEIRTKIKWIDIHTSRVSDVALKWTCSVLEDENEVYRKLEIFSKEKNKSEVANLLTDK